MRKENTIILFVSQIIIIYERKIGDEKTFILFIEKEFGLLGKDHIVLWLETKTNNTYKSRKTHVIKTLICNRKTTSLYSLFLFIEWLKGHDRNEVQKCTLYIEEKVRQN